MGSCGFFLSSIPSLDAPGASNADAKHSVICGSLIKILSLYFLLAAYALMCLVTVGDGFSVRGLKGIIGGYFVMHTP